MCDIIMRERKQRSIVLTTHSMEECEALCTRIGIMTAGRLQCLGGQQHLKSKYGGGYTLDLRVADAKAEALPARMARLFPGARLDQSHAGKLTYELPKFEATGGKSLAEVFETMERHKDALGILDYSASQPSLESIFLAIADKDINRKPREDGVARATTLPARKDVVPPSLELHAMPQSAAAFGKQEDSSETDRSGYDWLRSPASSSRTHPDSPSVAAPTEVEPSYRLAYGGFEIQGPPLSFRFGAAPAPAAVHPDSSA